MSKTSRLICALLLIVTACLMFAPVATFEDNSTGALQEEVDKYVERLDSAKAKLQRYIEGGKSKEDIEKQQKQVDKQQAKLDEVLAEQAAQTEQAGANGLKYALMPGKLPRSVIA